MIGEPLTSWLIDRDAPRLNSTKPSGTTSTSFTMASIDDAMELATDFEKQDNAIEDIDIDLGEGRSPYASEDENMFEDELHPTERDNKGIRFDEDDEMEDQEQGHDMVDDDIVVADQAVAGNDLLGDSAEGVLQEPEGIVPQATLNPTLHQVQDDVEEVEPSMVKIDPDLVIGTTPSPKEGGESVDLAYAPDDNDEDDFFTEDFQEATHTEKDVLDGERDNDPAINGNGSGVSQVLKVLHKPEQVEQIGSSSRTTCLMILTMTRRRNTVLTQQTNG